MSKSNNDAGEMFFMGKTRHFTPVNAKVNADRPVSEGKRIDLNRGSFGTCAIIANTDTVVKKNVFFEKNPCDHITQNDMLDSLLLTSLGKDALVMGYLNDMDHSKHGYVPRIRSLTHVRYIHEENNNVEVVREIYMQYAGENLFHYCVIQNNLLDVGDFLKQTLEALDFLNEAGVVHCDITVGNITYRRNSNQYQLIDFGSSEFVVFDVMTRFGLQTFFKNNKSENQQQATAAVLARTTNPGLTGLDVQYLPRNTLLHVTDAAPNLKSIHFTRQTSLIPYFDIQLALSKRPKFERLSHVCDCYSLGICAVVLAGLPCYHPKNDLSIMLYCMSSSHSRHFLKLCQSNVELRGSLTHEEVWEWCSHVNDDPSLVEELSGGISLLHGLTSDNQTSDFEKKTSLLDTLRDVYGNEVIDVLKGLLHPLQYRRLKAKKCLRMLESSPSNDNVSVVKRRTQVTSTSLGNAVSYKLNVVANSSKNVTIPILNMTLAMAEQKPGQTFVQDGRMVVNRFSVLPKVEEKTFKFMHCFFPHVFDLPNDCDVLNMRVKVENKNEVRQLEVCARSNPNCHLIGRVQDSNAEYIDVDFYLQKQGRK